jgi:PAS domain-containing protein
MNVRCRWVAASSGGRIKDRLARLGEAVAQALDQKQARDDRRQADERLIQQARELARSASALRDQTRVMKSILDSMGDGVIVADEKGALLLVNPAAERIIGMSATDTSSDEWSRRYELNLPDQVILHASLAGTRLDPNVVQAFLERFESPEPTASTNALAEGDRGQ